MNWRDEQTKWIGIIAFITIAVLLLSGCANNTVENYIEPPVIELELKPLELDCDWSEYVLLAESGYPPRCLAEVMAVVDALSSL